MKASLRNDLEWCVRHYDDILYGNHPKVQREEIGAHRLLKTPIAHPLFNCVFTIGEKSRLSLEESLQIAARMGGQPYSWWVSQENKGNVGPLLLKLGLQPAIVAKALQHCGTPPPFKLPEGFRFDEVGGTATAEEFCEALGNAYGATSEGIRFKRETTFLNPKRPQRAFVVRELKTGAAIAAGTLASFPGKPDIACLTGAVTNEGFRHQGIYRALTSMRLSIARDAGAKCTFLLGDSKSSVPICEGLGFEQVLGDITLYMSGAK